MDRHFNAPIGLLMSAGYGSNNQYSFLGGLRAAAQSISYSIPLANIVLSISLRAIRWDMGFLPNSSAFLGKRLNLLNRYLHFFIHHSGL